MVRAALSVVKKTSCAGKPPRTARGFFAVLWPFYRKSDFFCSSGGGFPLSAAISPSPPLYPAGSVPAPKARCRRWRVRGVRGRARRGCLGGGRSSRAPRSLSGFRQAGKGLSEERGGGEAVTACERKNFFRLWPLQGNSLR